MSRDAETIEAELSTVVSELKGLFDAEISAKNMLAFIAVIALLDAKVGLIDKFIRNLKFLSSILYLNASTTLISEYYQSKVETENSFDFNDADFAEIIDAFIEKSKLEEAKALRAKIEALEAEIKQLTIERITFLKTQAVPSELDQLKLNEIELLLRTLHMMVYDEPAFDSPIKMVMLKQTCPIVAEVKKVGAFLASYQKYMGPNATDFEREQYYYINKNFQNINIERHFPTAVQAVKDAVQKVKLEHPERDQVHADVICHRIAEIQNMALVRLKADLQRIEAAYQQEFSGLGHLGIRDEIIRLRDGFKAHLSEADYTALTKVDAELPFYPRIAATLSLIDDVEELLDPDLVTAGAKELAKTKYKSYVDDKQILKTHRLEMQSIMPKILAEHKEAGMRDMMRIVRLMQFVEMQLRDFLKADDSPLLNQGLFSNLYDALEGGPADNTLALTFG